MVLEWVVVMVVQWMVGFTGLWVCWHGGGVVVGLYEVVGVLP